MKKDHKIHSEEIVYDGFLKVLKAEVSHQKIEKDGVIHATRECLERGDSVAILIYEQDNDSFLFTRQYRYPSARRNHPWMLELVAGSIDDNESPEKCIKREVLEEIGYEIHKLEKITTYFPSPGGCSEQIHLFYCTVTSSDQTKDGGGLSTEKEDIQLVKIPRNEIKTLLANGTINNSISLIGLQWYLLNMS